MVEYLYRKVSTKNLKMWMMILSIIISYIILLFYITDYSEYGGSVFVSCILFVIICTVLIREFCENLIKPLFLFSLLYLTTCFTTWYLCITKFKTNNFAFATIYRMDFEQLFFTSLLFFLVGYIMLVVGYKIVPEKKNAYQIIYDSKEKISDEALNIAISVFYIVGILNFSINVYRFASGNIIEYFKLVSEIAEKFTNEGGTTLWYNFTIFGSYFLIFKYCRDNKKIRFKETLLLSIPIILKLSTGRIFDTMITMFVMIGIYYYYQLSKKKNVNNYLIIAIATILFIGIFFYMFRRASSMAIAGKDETWFESIIEGFKGIFYYAFDRGNTVNVAILPKIIDSWNLDVGFLCGESILISLLQGICSLFNIPTENFYWTIKHIWFNHVTGGGLPPTVIGEMYMNFGVVGIILGMFALGVFMKIIYNWFIKKQTFLKLIIYLHLTMGFFLLLPKTGSGNLPTFEIIFILAMYYSILILTKLINVFISGRYRNDRT